MLAGGKMIHKLPSHLQDLSHVVISPIRDKQPGWVMPRVLEVSSGNVVIENETSYAVKIDKDEAFADIVGMISPKQESKDHGQINKIL